MSKFKKPNIINKEIIINPNKEIMSKMDANGILEFANEYFIEVCGYEEYELMGKSIFCTQHPDMPKIIFKMMWDKLVKKENFKVLIKNLAKNGKYYWAISDFAFKLNENTGEIEAIYNRRVSATRRSILFFSNLYKKIKDIENESGIELSEKYLNGHLEEIGKSFTELLQEYNQNTKRVSSVTPVVSIVPPKQEEIIKEKKTPVKNKNLVKYNKVNVNQKTEELKKKAIELQKAKKEIIAKKVSAKKLNEKKSFFQRMFGKTEKELEEERLRKANKNK